MASVVIAGNTSGSVTLDAPAVAGTTVLTLPATSGTVVTTATTTGISGSAISTGTVAVSVGGTGVTTTTAYGVLAGGTTATGAFQNIGTGTTNQVLTSNGPGALPSFQAAAGGSIQTQVFTAPGTWTKPSSVSQVRVTVVGGGGGGGGGGYSGSGQRGGGCGGMAGYAQAIVPVAAPVGVTVGAGGTGGAILTAGGAGGTSSFGPAVSVTGGGAGPLGSGTPSPSFAPAGAAGAGTISSGTTLRNYSKPILTNSGASSVPLNTGYSDSISQGIQLTNNNPTAITFSTSAVYGAGFGGAGGNVDANQVGGGGIGGVIIVEWVG